jgi:hypothetical protein
LLFAQFSARPWALPSQVALDELRTFTPTPVFSELLYNLAYGEKQQGLPAGTNEQALVIGWGRRDLVCLPRQAKRALRLFPDAKLHWFSHSGHFPQLDVPQEAIRLILDVTSGSYQPQEVQSFVGAPQPKKVSPVFVTCISFIIGAGFFFAFQALRKPK